MYKPMLVDYMQKFNVNRTAKFYVGGISFNRSGLLELLYRENYISSIQSNFVILLLNGSFKLSQSFTAIAVKPKQLGPNVCYRRECMK